MKNIYLNIFRFNGNTLNKTIKCLKKNDIAALPTETVYGLAGNAYSKIASEKIYKIKNRPKINPLIVHYFDLESAKKDIILNESFLKLYRKFCPGPLTFILKKKKNSRISSKITAKLDTLAIRFPSHNIIRSVLKKIDFPLAMPSANISSGISPVTAKDVSEEFNKKIKIIIDGGKAKIGIESTVVDLSKKFKILRPGAITPKEISLTLKKKVSIIKKNVLIKSPGALKKHYSPGIPMKINQNKPFGKHAFITFGSKFDSLKHTFNLSKKSNLKEAASNLYKIFRKIKKLNYKKIYVIKIPNKDIGIAINDRLIHAKNFK